VKFPKLELNKPVAIDTETFGLNPWLGDSPFAVSVCDSNFSTFYWESSYIDPHKRICNYDTDVIEFLSEIISNPKCTVVMHNAKFDCRMLETYMGIELKAKLHETAIMARIAISNELNCGLKP
jgi:ribonuclease D